MLWILITSFVLSFILAFGLGANDVSNAFATSIGAKILSLKTAFLIASIAELLGAISLGGLVTENIQKYTLNAKCLTEQQLIIGMMATLLSVAAWLILATWLKLPVSTTHSVFSSIVGFCLVANPSAINWPKMYHMIAAWVIAPLLSGFISVLVFTSISWMILRKEDSYRVGCQAIPYIYCFTILINLALIIYQILYRTCTDVRSCVVPIVCSSVACLMMAVATFLFALLWIVPWIKSQVAKRMSEASFAPARLDAAGTVLASAEKAAPEAPAVLKATPLPINSPTEQLFAFLQILSAVFTSFAHGSNDVSNSVGPLVALYNAYLVYNAVKGLEPIDSNSPLLYAFLAYGSVGMIVGLYAWGARVIETIGTNLTAMSPSRGFAIELGSALTVLLCSITGFSVSTTHCKVGSIVAVGHFSYYITKTLHIKTTSSLGTKDGQAAREKGQEGGPLQSLPAAADAKLPPDDTESVKVALVNWRLCLNIVLSWFFTIPISGLLAAAFYALLELAI